jgi:cation diffusion facilitator CzcD-associated flavoprotein CzcO
MTRPNEPATLPAHVDVVIVGAGFSGLGMAIKLKQAGRKDFVVLERAADVGGTWQANTYPGCQCDVPSNLYSFSFAPNPDWGRTFAMQPEIWDYLRKVADDFGIRPHIQLSCEVEDCAWDETTMRWRIETSQGSLTARVLIAGAGGICEPSIPDLPGLESFEGAVFHTARWDHDHDLAGRSVAVVGTGASAIQVVPNIQPLAGKLSVFQRTPPWIMPHPGRPVRASEKRIFRRLPVVQKAVRSAVYWGRELYVVPFKRRRFRRFPERMALRHLAKQVADPELRRKLAPDYEIGCKRILLSNEYYPALQQPNVELVTEAVVEVRPRSVITATVASIRSTRSSGGPASGSARCRSATACGDAVACCSATSGASTACRRCAARRSPASPTSSCSWGRTPASATTRSSS